MYLKATTMSLAVLSDVEDDGGENSKFKSCLDNFVWLNIETENMRGLGCKVSGRITVLLEKSQFPV